jgi:NitT/TauT family transport system ATP-binding protein
MSATILRCCAVSHSYQSRARTVGALSNLSFDVRRGEFVSVIGPSGCGKTTLLHVLAGLLPPAAGRVELPESVTDRLPQTSLVFQENSMFPWMTVVQNAAFGLEMRGVDRQDREHRASVMLERFGLGSRERDYPHQLSTGMKQRVAVIRAFLSGAPVLLMDEPFAALDRQTRMKVQLELMDLWESERATVVFVTHDVDEALLLSDRIVVLSAQPGTVVAEFRVPTPRPRPLLPERGDQALDLKREIFEALGLTSELTRCAWAS